MVGGGVGSAVAGGSATKDASMADITTIGARQSFVLNAVPPKSTNASARLSADGARNLRLG